MISAGEKYTISRVPERENRKVDKGEGPEAGKGEPRGRYRGEAPGARL